MLGELAIALGDLTARHGEGVDLGRAQVLRGHQKVESLIDPVRREQPAEPTVESQDHAVFA
ncbi:hypothetical protein [Nonomuraea rubra]|uniref:hypothetical protein n=1 Tax=Nonomuraea rubra TaxID=46180 RepID=UPI001C86A60C|nr:hypothetical protein [Nonomuraea rubra]